MTAAEVEDVATYYVMFFREPVGEYAPAGLPDIVVRARRGRTRQTEALSEKLGIEVGRD